METQPVSVSSRHWVVRKKAPFKCEAVGLSSELSEQRKRYLNLVSAGSLLDAALFTGFERRIVMYPWS